VKKLELWSGSEGNVDHAHLRPVPGIRVKSLGPECPVSWVGVGVNT